MGLFSSKYRNSLRSKGPISLRRTTSFSDVDNELAEAKVHLPTKKRTVSGPLDFGTAYNSGDTTSGSSWDGRLVVFKLSDMQKATENFSPGLLVGEGGFGRVYRGKVRLTKTDDPVHCAVKRLNSDSFQGQGEWLTEILLLSRLKHPNLVKLFGYCSEGGEGILVYEFLPKGSVDYHIFGPFVNNMRPMPWSQRLKILLQSAEALQYLHSNDIIHRDFKPPNVLLDKDYNAKLTDFGLAKDTDADKSHITTKIMGTLGYLDPRYLEVGHLSKRSDTYSFGVMILELMTGRKAVDPTVKDAVPLTIYAQKVLEARKPDLEEFLDPNILPELMATKNGLRTAHKLAIAAKHCIEKDPKFRPPLSDMVDTLKALNNNAKRG